MVTVFQDTISEVALVFHRLVDKKMILEKFPTLFGVGGHTVVSTSV